jgi:hypothetical protein
MFIMHTRAKRFAAAATMLLAYSMVVDAQTTLTGKWQGETPSGSAIVLNLTTKGTTLTGTLIRGDVSSVLSDGKVSKNQFTFKAKVNDQTEAFSGELADNAIKVWLDRQGASTAIVLKRAKTPRPDQGGGH